MNSQTRRKHKKSANEVNYYLQVVEDEEERFCGQSLVELYGVRVVGWYLMVVGQSGTWIPHQVLPLKINKKSENNFYHQTFSPSFIENSFWRTKYV